MAKITELIQGYADMTAEEKLAALEGLDQPENKPDPEVNKLKTQLSKANGEAAEYKRKLQERMTEDEKKKAQEDEDRKKLEEERENLRKENAALLKDKTISGYKASYLAMGYDEALAEDTAKAMADGDMSKVFANQKTFQEAHDKAVLAGAVKTTPTPPAGNPGTPAVTAERFAKMGYSERAELKRTQPELYETLMGRKSQS